MNKKWIAAIVLVALAALIAVPVFAAVTPENKPWPDRQMYSFQQQNGFVCPMGGPGGAMCRGGGMMGGWGLNQSPPAAQ